MFKAQSFSYCSHKYYLVYRTECYPQKADSAPINFWRPVVGTSALTTLIIALVFVCQLFALPFRTPVAAKHSWNCSGKTSASFYALIL